MGEKEINDAKVKYLEMIQNNISRMGSNSFIIKGWSVTSLSAMYAYWISNKSNLVLYLILVVVLLFWVHDAYYLRIERGFRELYNQALEQQIPSFVMTPKIGEKYYNAFLRPVFLISYLPVVFVTVVLIIKNFLK